MKRILRDERGMALAVAIFALVIVGALVAGAFFAGTQEQRVGENQRRVQTSFGVAEAGVQERVMSWQPDSMNKRPLYPDSVPIYSVSSPATTPGGTGRYFGYSYKLGANIFLIDVTGRDRASAAGLTAGGSGARQRIGMITRIAPIDFGIKASLTTQGGVSLQGNATVNGADQNPTGWVSCDPPGPVMPGVRDNGGNVSTGGNGNVTGNPPVVNDPGLSSGTFTQFGGTTYSALAAQANIQLGSGNYKTEPRFTGTGACDKSVLTNWGDGVNPNSACGTYFPIIHIAGDATLNGDQGQGVLLVDGTLSVQGSYQFFGITIIQGDLNTAGGGSTDAHFWGGVMAKNADLSIQSLSGHATLNYSSCSILSALQGTSHIAMMRQRGWVQLY